MACWDSGEKVAALREGERLKARADVKVNKGRLEPPYPAVAGLLRLRNGHNEGITDEHKCLYYVVFSNGN